MITSEQAETMIKLLASIDDKLQRKNARAERMDNRIKAIPSKYLEPIKTALPILSGRRLSANEVATIIGAEFNGKSGADRIAFGQAMRQIPGVKRTKSGSARFYVFP